MVSDMALGRMDGVSQVSNLGSRYSSRHKYRKRQNMLIALTDYRDLFTSDCSTADAAYRWKDWKLIYGTRTSIRSNDFGLDEWVIPAESPNLPIITGDSCLRTDEDGNMVARCLFNLKDDPFEQNNLFDDPKTRRIVRRLLSKINVAKRRSVKNTYSPPLGAIPLTTKSLGNLLVPRPGYCNPAIDFPLIANNRSCSA